MTRNVLVVSDSGQCGRCRCGVLGCKTADSWADDEGGDKGTRSAVHVNDAAATEIPEAH